MRCFLNPGNRDYPAWNLIIRGIPYNQKNWRDILDNNVPNHDFPSTNYHNLRVSNLALADNGNTYQCFYPQAANPNNRFCSRIATLYVTGEDKLCTTAKNVPTVCR